VPVVRMVLEHRGRFLSEWTVIGSIAAKIGCDAETPRSGLRRAERDRGVDGVRGRGVNFAEG